jgi:1-phosphatidylinositol-3-phosphate 5-kinase
MTFHGLTPGSGCVLTLRGGSTSALAAVESATRKSARAAYHLDRVAAFVSAAASSHVGQSSKARQAKVDRFVYALLQKSVETEFTNATVQIVSRAFCPARVASVACDPPVGFRSTFPEKKLDKDKIPFSFLEIVPYGPEDLPLGAALAQAVRAERGLTECPHAKCGEHPAAHVRVFYVAGGKVTLRARRREKHEKNFFSSNQKEKGDDFLDADVGTWTYWSRCRSCLPEETRTDKDTFLSRHSEHGDAKRHFPFATPAFGSASPVAAPKRALELSLARFLELVGAAVPEAVFDGLDASRLDGDCVHASPRDRAHYFASALGTVCFAFDETSPLALVVSPTGDSPSSYEQLATERKTASSARFDARCAAAAAALRSDAYEAATATFGSFTTRDDDVSRFFEKTGSSDAAAVASEHVVVASVGVTAYFARQFRQARREWWNGKTCRMTQNDDSTTITEHDEDVEAVFANALSQCAYWDVGARGGKSRAFFARSNDGRFVAKQVSKTELECLLSADFAAAYFSRVCANRETNASGNETRLDSLLAATLGAFSVAPSKLSSRRDESTISPIPSAGAFDFVVLENAFFGVGDISSLNLRVYDLKGSLRGRYAVGFANDGAETKRDANDSVTREYASSSSEKEKEKDAVVLMDGNLAETCAIEPLLITRESFVSLERLIRADVAFLAARNVMDYSLLVGIPLDVDKNPGDASGRAPRRAVVKIIDYLRMYTWDKQIESAVKSGVLSGEEAPTVLSPEKYARRFRRATRRYFLAVPDALSRESFEK